MRTREIIRRIRQQCEGEENFDPSILGWIERQIQRDPRRGRAWWAMIIAWNSLESVDPGMLNQFLESIWAKSAGRREYRKHCREAGLSPSTLEIIDKRQNRKWKKALDDGS